MARIIINNVEFSSKAAAQSKAKDILYRNQVGSNLTGVDYKFMYDYFSQFHNEWPAKKGLGISNIRVIMEPVYGKHRGFKIFRVDGTSTDISYIISNIKKKDPLTEFKIALRWIVEPYITEYRKIIFTSTDPVICAVTGVQLTPEETHIDHHQPSFNEIVDNFISLYNISDFKRYIQVSRDNQHKTEIKDQNLANIFYNYHAERCNLRPLSITANLTKKK